MAIKRWIILAALLAFPLFLSADDSVSLERKIGQLIMVGFRGYEIGDEAWISLQIREGLIGGVILYDYDVEHQEFARNIRSSNQLQSLCESLQKDASIPLLIAIDQEGGKIDRLSPKYGFPPSLSAQALGEKNDLQTTRQEAERTAHTLAQLGINLNFAPDVDLNVNPENPVIGKKERSFSANPDIVIAHAKEVIRGHHRFNVLTALKHFPGHGSSTSDSHEGFVDVTKTWSEIELEPYRSLIVSGDADVILTAHVFNQKLDPHVPATLSPAIITGILRNRLKFEGVIITDDLHMKAIDHFYSLEEIIKRALDADVDILLFANQQLYDPQIAPKAIGIIKQLIASGEIPLSRIDRSFGRIQALKAGTKGPSPSP